jgi:hypothetical protein
MDSFHRKAEFDDPFGRWAKDMRPAAFVRPFNVWFQLLDIIFMTFSLQPQNTTDSILLPSPQPNKQLRTQLSSKDEYERQPRQVTAELEGMGIRKQQEAKFIGNYR